MVLRVGEAAFFPMEFFHKLVGAKKGKEFVIDTQFPAEHINRNIAGKKVPLTVVVSDIKKKKAPGFDDELAKDMGYDTLEAFKKNIADVIGKSKKAEMAGAQKAEIMKKLVELHDFDVPESLVDKETEVLATNAMVITAEAKPGEDDKDETAFNSDLRNDAIKKVKAAVLIELIGQKEGVRVTEDDIKLAIGGMSRSYSITPEQLMKFYTSKEGAIDRLKNSIFEEKVLDLILSKAVVVKGE
jgi:trigger factor